MAATARKQKPAKPLIEILANVEAAKYMGDGWAAPTPRTPAAEAMHALWPDFAKAWEAWTHRTMTEDEREAMQEALMVTCSAVIQVKDDTIADLQDEVTRLECELDDLRAASGE